MRTRLMHGFIILSLLSPGLVCAQEAPAPAEPEAASPAVAATPLVSPSACEPLAPAPRACTREKDETLFDMGVYSHGGYFGPAVRVTGIDGRNEWMAGGRAGWIINHNVILGVAGYGLTTDHIKREIGGQNRTLRMGYGGLDLGYVFKPHSLLHLTFQTLVGAGGIGYEWETDRTDRDGNRRWDADGSGFFVAEPMLYAELNVTPWFRVCAGGGYRWVDSLDASKVGIDAKTLRGASGELMLKFGFF